MTREQIDTLITRGKFPEGSSRPELVETHISWVILCDQYVYKIKRPIRYSFLDFSTIGLRKYYCEREVVLNRRLSGDVYIGVEPVYHRHDCFCIGREGGEVIDYAVKMHKLDPGKQMDVLLSNGKVTSTDIQRLALKIASFHQQATIINERDALAIQNDFNDLADHKDYVRGINDITGYDIIQHAMDTSNSFIKKNSDLLHRRLKEGYFRDCHGDLHSRNIFLLPEPVPFDCIEFNEGLRQIDVLNEVAFLCMDLDALGHADLSGRFIDNYNRFFPAIAGENDHRLFIYYKGYRANVRAKVNILRAKSATDDGERNASLMAAKKYLLLMDSYLKSPGFLR
jgi:uncharacterized protein